MADRNTEHRGTPDLDGALWGGHEGVEPAVTSQAKGFVSRLREGLAISLADQQNLGGRTHCPRPMLVIRLKRWGP